ncbi:MAG: PilZ domain-containing protein [Sphingomonas adhaesiva]|uniref:PilZ domain-containing protein n=1 Tax=Sphingomonas adhaesiva TaxID=28212 RepID=UPI002FF4C54A
MSHAPAREARSSVILYAAIENGSEPVECRVRNLSATGACIDNHAGLVEGDAVTVLMGALRPLSAQVKWANPRLAGLHFDKLIDLAVARQPRPRTAASAPPAAAPPPSRPTPAASAGWMQHINNPYRRS